MSYASGPRPGRSPMFYVGMGCLVLFGLGFVGCIGLGVAGLNFFKGVKQELTAAADTPIPEEQVRAGLKEVPIYPDSEMLDTRETRMMRAIALMVLKRMGMSGEAEIGVFSATTPYEKIREFYDRKLEALGYTPVPPDENDSPDEKEWSYRKESTLVALASGAIDEKTEGKETPSSANRYLMITRLDGVSENFQYRRHKRGRDE